MHAMDFYITTCRCVMQADPEDAETWAELYRLLPCLRQSLGCYVCFKLLQDPMGPTENVCKHSVCRKCIGGKMKLKPACSWCKDHWFFEPNSLQNMLVSCFKKLCSYILTSPLGDKICNSGRNGQSNNVYNILKEVADFSVSSDETEQFVNETSASIDMKQVSFGSESDLDKQCVSSLEKQGCSSDDDYGLFVSGSEGDEATHDDHETSEQTVDVSTQNEIDDSSVQQGQNTQKKTIKGQDKGSKKTVVFFKRASENKNKRKKITQTLKKMAIKKRHSAMKKRTISLNKNKSNSKSTSLKRQEEAPNDLEKMDFSEPTLKKIKQELPPPELKPLTSCKCGKSGTTNQLTCLGQRCQCYSMKLPCIGCKCRGCRNPKRGPDSSEYQTSGIYGSSYLRSGTRSLAESVCVNM